MSTELRIASFSIHAYALPYARPVSWFDSVETEGRYVLLQLTGADGESGISEAPIRPTWSGMSLRSLVALLEDVMLPAVMELDLNDAFAVAAALARFPENRLAKTMVDNACWSLRAAAMRKPLWQLWGGRRTLELSWCVTRQVPALMAAEAAEMVARHRFSALKVKGGQGRAMDLEAVRQIRSAVGDPVSLSVDANCAYAYDDALAYVRALADAGVTVVEDPCRMTPDIRFADLLEASPLPILVDTQCASVSDAAAFLDHGATALSVKPGRIGLTEARQIATLADARGASLVAGLFGESAIGTVIGLTLASTLRRIATPAELSFYLMLTEQVLAQPLVVTEGRVTLPAASDMATLVDWDRVRRFALPIT